MRFIKSFESIRWGSIGAGILPFCLSTKRFLMSYRSKMVYEPHTWGVWGGKIENSDNDIKHSALREFQEESGYGGEIDIIDSFIYKESNFTYYNFIGIVDSEFNPNLDFLNEFGEIETEGYKWVTFDELLDIPSKHFGLEALVENGYNQLKDLSNGILEGVDFKENFTPLYHISSLYNLKKIISEDSLKPGNPARGPKGICLTRSKYFEHDGNLGSSSIRFILNSQLLKIGGYKSYPLDEWSLSRPISHSDYSNISNRQNWVDRQSIKKTHAGKSNFNHTKSGMRPISHNISGLPAKKGNGLEVEYEERIIKPIKNLGKYIYAINFIDESASKVQLNKELIDNYLQKYPHIKILIGKFKFNEIK